MGEFRISKLKFQKTMSFLAALFVFCLGVHAQETPPAPSVARAFKIPTVREKVLPNGLTVATVERKNVPLVTVQLLVKRGASNEDALKAGLANLTASLLTKGTKTRTATQIAEQLEFLGATSEAGADWNKSVISINVMADKLDEAMAILSDIVLNPKLDPKELDLLKSQTLDALAYDLKQPGFLAAYTASKYSFGEHPAGGTPETVKNITVEDVARFKKNYYLPVNMVLILTGDLTSARANALAQKFFGRWQNKINGLADPITRSQKSKIFQPVGGNSLVNRILVVDLPNSGQASVNYARFVPKGRIVFDEKTTEIRAGEIFYPALVLNSVLGGGYSARLNQEIRIKRGLSYGAGSSFAWRGTISNFSTRTQTKDVSAAEVAELVLAEIKKLTEDEIPETELAPRKLVLTGDFGRELETTAGLAQTVAALYTYNLPLAELNTHLRNVNAVAPAAMKSFASEFLKGGDLIIVGDYAIFRDDLAKRFPNLKIEVVKADELDLSRENLRK